MSNSLPPAEKYIIDPIMPARSFHLLTGPSGANKTTWMIQMMEQMRQGRKILDHTVYPRPFVYMCADRPESHLQMTLERMQSKLDFPIYDIGKHRAHRRDLKLHLKTLRRLHPVDSELVIIDGIHGLIPGGKMSDFDTVATLIGDLYKMAEDNNQTFWGIGYSPKVKSKEEYLNPRQRCMGSSAFSTCSDFMVDLQPTNLENAADGGRTLIAMGRNSPTIVVNYKLNALGRLVEVVDLAHGENVMLMEEFLKSLKPGEPHRRAEFIVYGDKQGISTRWVDSWLDAMVKDGRLVKSRYGMYEVPWKA